MSTSQSPLRMSRRGLSLQRCGQHWPTPIVAPTPTRRSPSTRSGPMPTWRDDPLVWSPGFTSLRKRGATTPVTCNEAERCDTLAVRSRSSRRGSARQRSPEAQGRSGRRPRSVGREYRRWRASVNLGRGLHVVPRADHRARASVAARGPNDAGKSNFSGCSSSSARSSAKASS